MNEQRRDAAAFAPATGDPTIAHASALDVLDTVLNSLDALVYVSDFQTHELLFVSRYGMDIWGRPDGRLCYQSLQQALDSLRA